MRTIITITREFGAGGGEIGRKLAEALKIPFYDKAIILTAAKQSQLDVESLRKWDERVPKAFGFGQSLFDFYGQPLDEQLFAAQKQAIVNLAEQGSCVLVGRNADYILKEYDHVCNVFIYAGFDWRVNRMSGKMPELTRSKVAMETKAVDKARRKYCEFYTGREWGKTDSFDLCLNSERLGIDRCVSVIIHALKYSE